ncbi:MAG: hypothetical protein GF313_04080 [Caldithrix sp.]|nr:hypothetical protein [Caldithrix sp.]
MFTDLIQSTALYSEIGDMKAYVFVQNHFKILFENIIKSHRRYYQNHHMQNKSGLKIGLSRGSALIVNLNDPIDLFGTTVNLAARVLNVSTKDCVVITSTLLERSEVREMIQQMQFEIKSTKHQLKGSPSEVHIHHLYSDTNAVKT